MKMSHKVFFSFFRKGFSSKIERSNIRYLQLVIFKLGVTAGYFHWLNCLIRSLLKMFDDKAKSLMQQIRLYGDVNIKFGPGESDTNNINCRNKGVPR